MSDTAGQLWVAKQVMRASASDDPHAILEGRRIVADVYGPNAEERSALIVKAVNSHKALVEALRAVIAATQAYLPPDGIDAQECLNRILAATDNPEINAALRLAEGEGVEG